MPRWSLTVLLAAAAVGAAWLASLATGGTPSPTSTGAGGWIPEWNAPPAGAGCLEVTTELLAPAVAPSAETWGLITVRGAERCGKRGLPVDLALVMDTSGSMRAWRKIDEARAAALALADALGPSDRVSFTTFGDSPDVLLPLSTDRDALRSLAAGVVATGATNLSGGLIAGLGTLPDDPGRVARVLLLTDGQATTGVVTAAGLARIAADQRAAVSTVGLGEDYAEDVLTAIADAGRGSYRYAERGSELSAVYVGELDQARHLAVRDARLVVSVDGADFRVEGWPSTSVGEGLAVPVGDLAAGETRKIVVRITPGAGERVAVRARVTGGDPGGEATWGEEALAYGVVDDRSAATAPESPTVGAAVAHLRAGLAVEEARAAWTRGDDAGARGVLFRARRETQSAGETIPEALTALGYLDAVEGAPSPAVAAKRASEVSRGLAR